MLQRGLRCGARTPGKQKRKKKKKKKTCVCVCGRFRVTYLYQGGEYRVGMCNRNQNP